MTTFSSYLNKTNPDVWYVVPLPQEAKKIIIQATNFASKQCLLSLTQSLS